MLMKTTGMSVCPLGRRLVSTLKSAARLFRLGCAMTMILSPWHLRALGAVNVLTSHNDNTRQGANTNETVLTRAVVGSGNFGRLANLVVDGQVHGQPLVLTGISIPNLGVRDLVFAVTQHDSVYAFDANGPIGTQSGVIWHTSFINPAAGITTVPIADVNSADIPTEIGITSTPVIDPDGGVIYVEAKTKEPGPTYVHRLHALDVRTGAEMPGSPVIIAATVRGNGDGNDGAGNVPFNPLRQMCRPGLTLLKTPAFTNSIVYLAFASHGDNGPYHGWLLGYDSKTLKQVHVFNSTPNGGLGGFWMAGNGPAADSRGDLYLITGNGGYNGGATYRNFGDSYLRLSTATSRLTLTDWFTPFNQASLNAVDADLGSGGNVVLPDSVGSASHPHLLVGCGKEGKIYLLDRDNMGQYNPSADTQIVQSLSGVISGTWSSPAYFNGRLYYQGVGDVLKAIAISNASVNRTIVSRTGQAFGYPGATPSISANGVQDSIAWVIQTDGAGNGGPAVLHAYNADNLQQELYNSSAQFGRDNPGPAVKYAVPTIANGHVYVGTGNALSIYGIENTVATPTFNPSISKFTNGVQVTISVTNPGAQIFYTIDGSEPTVQSLAYQGPILVTNSLTVRAKAFATGLTPSQIAAGVYYNMAAVGAGIGLQGDYFTEQAMTLNPPTTVSRFDPGINFNWGMSSPDPAISPDWFTVRWTGQIQAQFSEPYTLYFTAKDGVRLWLNGQKLIDGWAAGGPTEFRATNTLVAGQRYDLRIEYFSTDGPASAVFEWSSSSTPRQPVPAALLFPPVPSNLPPTVAWLSPAVGSSVTGPASLFLSANAFDSDGTVQSVAFYNGATLLAQVSSPPYAVTWTRVPPGSYTLTAVATDNLGATASSTISGIQVTEGNGSRFGLNSRPQFAAYLRLPQTAGSPFPSRLSQTGVFNDVPTLSVRTGLLEYGVNLPDWSDGAVKRRWMGIPYSGGPLVPAQQISFDPELPFQFPAGSVFVQHFDIQTNELNPNSMRRLETRLLVVPKTGPVFGATYRWRVDNSDADRVDLPATENLIVATAGGQQTQTWYYPSSGDCISCHNTSGGGILGASKVRQLNGDWTYIGNGATDNQLRTLNHIGLFNPPLDEAIIPAYPKFHRPEDTEIDVGIRAASYLDVNCAHCHQSGTGISRFDARLTTPLYRAGIVNGSLTTPSIIPGAKVVVPGDELRSALYQRIVSTDQHLRMPPVVSSVVDSVGASVLAQWIDELAGEAPELSIHLDGGGIHVAWPSTTTPFYLLQANDQHVPLQWTAGPGPSWINGQYQVDLTDSRQSHALLFRLTSQKPNGL